MVLTTNALAAKLPAAARERAFLFDGDWRAALRARDERKELPQMRPPSPNFGLDSLAYVTFTSGTTGAPKAIQNTHRGASTCFVPLYSLYPYDEGEREGMNVFFAWNCLRYIRDPPQCVDSLSNPCCSS